MKRTSKYYPLRFIVERQVIGLERFVPFAAFHEAQTAIEYAKDSVIITPRCNYRVVDHRTAQTTYRSDNNAAA